MLSCAGADRLQQGMRGAWGKPYGKVARVNIGQVILSIRCKDSNKAVIMEALRRARYKCKCGRVTRFAAGSDDLFLVPGQQRIIISKKWGFTPLDRPDYEALKANKQVLEDGAYVQYLKPKGNLVNNLRRAERV